MKREAGAVAGAGETAGLLFDTLYIGGGTPSLLGSDDIAAVRELAQARFPAEFGELTLEANP
ncbi:MAG TPA: coproporphyrinogen III oxidase, partial [Acidobacteriota bacterium]|nr:coproporphyrinogen III oxidase [Acidobacteriota bacterium]